MRGRRTILIGDVHGCYRELDDLTGRLDLDIEHDRLLFVGDLVNRGPSSREVWLRAKAWEAECILGNHEWAMLQALRGSGRSKAWIRSVQRDFGPDFDDFVDDLRTWPVFIEEEQWLLVHAGLIPGRPPAATAPEHLVTIRTWDGVGEDLQDPNNPPWFEHYHGRQVVVFGHWAALGGVHRPNAVGLDTGCVYGNRLTSLIWPERRLVSVPARRSYVCR